MTAERAAEGPEPEARSDGGGAVADNRGANPTGFRFLRMRTLAEGADTDGAFELVEDQRNKGEGPAPHVHHRSDEAFYVIDGSFRFSRGADELDAVAGSYVFVPRGTAHRYSATADGSRLLILYVPATGFCDYLRAIDTQMAQGLTSAEAMRAIQGRFDTTPA